MENIRLSDGELRWVFPGLPDTAGVSAQIRLLANHLAVRPGWTGSGTEFHRLPSGATSLFGCAERDDVTFVVELGSFDRCGSASVGPPWIVEGEIAVGCDARVECGTHPVERTAERLYESPLEAAAAVLEVATWLRRRGFDEPLDQWRQRDPRRGHG